MRSCNAIMLFVPKRLGNIILLFVSPYNTSAIVWLASYYSKDMV